LKTTSEELLIQIRNQIAAYQLNVKSDNKAHRYNINDRAESFTIPLFKLLFKWNGLEDLNKKDANFPGIDLGDFDNRIAIQVTSDTSLEKVKSTAHQYIEREYYNQFNRLIIFMIQEKQSSYSQQSIDAICNNKFNFNAKDDIYDLSHLLQFAKSLSLDELEKILKLFQDETGFVENQPVNQKPISKNSLFSAPTDPPFEIGILNLLEIGFPETLFIAEWNFTKKQLGTRLRNDRKLIQEALEQKNLKFAADWVTNEKQIITFHDLGDELIPLAKIVDQGTVTELGTQEFYENPVYRNKFVELLQRCLQRKLYKLGIQWQNEEKEYIFVPVNEQDAIREIRWKGEKADTRTVYKKIPDLKDKTKTYCHEHFSFQSRFYEFDLSWYLAITPDWFYSSDGYKRAWYAIEEKRKYKKLVEANQNVSTHVRFIHSFISTNNPQDNHQIDMFAASNSTPHTYDFLWIKSLQEIGHLPRLHDADWRPVSNNYESSDLGMTVSQDSEDV